MVTRQNSCLQDKKPAPGWVALKAEEQRRDIRLPSPPLAHEPRNASEPAVFRQPARKRPRTRWHAEEAGDRQNGEEAFADDSQKPAAPGIERDDVQQAEAKQSRRQSTQAVEKRKPSPQVLHSADCSKIDFHFHHKSNILMSQVGCNHLPFASSRGTYGKWEQTHPTLMPLIANELASMCKLTDSKVFSFSNYTLHLTVHTAGV